MTSETISNFTRVLSLLSFNKTNQSKKNFRPLHDLSRFGPDNTDKPKTRCERESWSKQKNFRASLFCLLFNVHAYTQRQRFFSRWWPIFSFFDIYDFNPQNILYNYNRVFPEARRFLHFPVASQNLECRFGLSCFRQIEKNVISPQIVLSIGN